MIRPMHQVDSLDDLADCQGDVVSRHQLRELGVTRYRLRAQLKAGRWQEAGREAIVLHSGPLTERQEWWCAVFDAGPRAVLGGITAAQANNPALTGFGRRPIHIVVPNGHLAVRPAGVKVHVSRHLDEDAVHPVALPPRTTIHRSISDAATWTDRPRHGCALLAAAVQQRLTRPADLRKMIEPRRWHSSRGLYLATLDDIEGGAHALTELDFFDLCRRHDLPVPTGQDRRKDSHGRTRYLDAVWADRGLAVEVDGAPHLDVLRAWDDTARQNEIVLESDLRVLRFPSVALRIDEETVASQLRRGLNKGGWRRAA